MSAEPLIAELSALLRERPDQITLAPGQPGGNNRIFMVTVGERKFVAKVYFRDASDTRDRLGAEYGFLVYAQRLGLETVPGPVARNEARGIGVYEFVEGRQVAATEVDGGLVDQAIAFFLAMNPGEAHAYAAELPEASEACFSVREHLAMVDGRIARLSSIPADEALGREAIEFTQALAAKWEAAKAGIRRRLRRAGENEGAPVGERCVSPSDFGFHNAIRRPSGKICFLDFEYAGWDDPAKMAGDFFCHPAVPVGMEHYERFLAETMRYSGCSRQLEARARLLFPVFQTKWCCIILNDFLPESARRRRFADPELNMPERKRTQLAKAERLLARIVDGN
jgi:hypothetical protein